MHGGLDGHGVTERTDRTHTSPLTRKAIINSVITFNPSARLCYASMWVTHLKSFTANSVAVAAARMRNFAGSA